MKLVNIITKAAGATLALGTIIVTLPVLGPIGVISVGGACLAAGVGTTAAIADEIIDANKK